MIKEGRFPNAYEFLPTGRIVVLEDSKAVKAVIYARVSSADQKSQMPAQSERIGAYLQSLGIKADDTVFEIGSRRNGKRLKLKAILHNKSITHIAVEPRGDLRHRDRLAGFGFEYI